MKSHQISRSLLCCVCITIGLAANCNSIEYVPKGPTETEGFEKGLYQLLPGYVHGIYPKASLLADGVSEESLSPQDAMRMTQYKKEIESWLNRVLRIELKPKQFSRPDWLGIRKLHLDRAYIVGRFTSPAKEASSYRDAVVEFQADDRSISLTMSSGLLFAADANGLSSLQISDLASKVLNIPHEKVSKIDVEKHLTTLAGVEVCYGKMRCEWNEREPDYTKRQWWSYIPFWYVKGRLFVNISTMAWKEKGLPASTKSSWVF